VSNVSKKSIIKMKNNQNDISKNLNSEGFDNKSFAKVQFAQSSEMS